MNNASDPDKEYREWLKQLVENLPSHRRPPKG